METRKRQIADDAEATLPKKRALIDNRGSPTPHVNGLATDGDEPKDDNLELFRKEAIYRRMKHYSREYERSQGRIRELERLRRTVEAGLAALEACWTQLLEAAKSLVKPEDIPVDAHANDLFDLTTGVSTSEAELVAALKGKVRATSEVLGLLARGDAGPVLRDQMFQKCQRAQTEATGLRSEVQILKVRLRDAQEERDRYREDLARSQIRVDRLQSETVRSAHGIDSPKPEPPSSDAKVEVAEEQKPQQSVSPPPPGESASAILESTCRHYEALAKHQAEHIEELQQDLSTVTIQLKRTEIDLAIERAREDSVTVTPDERKKKADREEKEKEQNDLLVYELETELRAAQSEIKQLSELRQQLETEFKADSEKALSEAKAMIAKRNVELARLRDARDQQAAELAERKARDDHKFTAFGELEKLAESRSQRVTVLQSEVTRLKTRFAADAGDADLMSFLLGDHDDVLYVADLRQRLQDAEARLTALGGTFQNGGTSLEVQQRLVEISKQLQQYQSTFGDLTNLPQGAAEALRLKEADVQKLRLQVSQHVQAETALYAELDKLSAAWESLDKQVNDKVSNLAALEEKVSKAGVDRAKSENKYFAAMRDKEAMETERKNLIRNAEKQLKAVDQLRASERNLETQVTSLNVEASRTKEALGDANARIDKFQKTLKNQEDVVAVAKQRIDKAERLMKDEAKLANARRSELTDKLTEASEAKKAADEALAQARSAPSMVSVPSSVREAQLQSELEKCMSILKCSTCRQRMRSTVITKCMHSFCKDCVDARISTRQRKCPACNIPFGQADVQHLYFQ